jgi:hypothetical protein
VRVEYAAEIGAFVLDLHRASSELPDRFRRCEVTDHFLGVKLLLQRLLEKR